ncbi:response regulator transcription factor [bacterium]|nr:response regulator transcription factor [bacterium]
MASIFLLDSEPFTRDGIRTYLHKATNNQVVGEEESGLAAIPLILSCRPEVLISDLNLPGLDGLEVIRRLHSDIPSMRIVVYTRKFGGSFISRAVKYGANAYVLKNSPRTELISAISAVLNGHTYFSDIVSHFVGEDGSSVDQYEDLTIREREVLQQVAEGKTAHEMSEELFISVRTAEKHRSNLMKKLDIHSHNGLIRYALQRSLIPF